MNIQTKNIKTCVLKNRTEFLQVAQGIKASGRFLTLQLKTTPFKGETKISDDQIRYGLTASKKVGNAVARNRAKRRLRVALKNLLPQFGLVGANYVAIARPQTIIAPWSELLIDIENLLKRLSSSQTKAIKRNSKSQETSANIIEKTEKL